MDAAEQHVRQYGADGFSYADLSAEVGISKASIHYHFPAKPDLLTAIMARYSMGVMDILEGFSKTLATAGEQLGAFLNLYRAALQDGSVLCLCVAYAVSRDGLSEDTRAEMVRFRAKVLFWLEQTLHEALVEDLISNSCNKQAEAASILALAEGAQISARISGDLASFDKAIELLKNRYKKAP